MFDIQFSDFVEQFQPGIFTVLDEKKHEFLQAGRKVYNLSVGTPDFKPAPHVMEAMTEACQNPDNYKYMRWQICRSFWKQYRPDMRNVLVSEWRQMRSHLFMVLRRACHTSE